MKTGKVFAVTIILSVFSCATLYAQGNPQMNMDMKSPVQGQKAICVLYPTAGNTVTGTVTFTKTADGIQVVADLRGLTKGPHGFHIHEFGDCSSADGSSAGGHFNPGMKQHSGPMDMNRHTGDMGNIEADDSGKAHLEYTDHMMTFDGPNSIIGRGVIVHKNADDLKSQPAGNAGPRVACGVIGVSK